MRASRGFTLVEIIIYSFLSLLILMTVYAIFSQGREAYSQVTDAYLLGKDAEAGLRMLRSDLQETALSSIRIKDRSDGDSSLSMISARKYGADEFETSPFGGPRWQKYVHYTVSDSTLVRWEEKVADLSTVLFPLPSAADPTTPVGAEKKVVIRNLVRPGAGLGAKNVRFLARFVRYAVTPASDGSRRVAEKMTVLSPAEFASAPPAGFEGTQPVSEIAMQLTVASDTSTKLPRFIQLPVVVSPRY